MKLNPFELIINSLKYRLNLSEDKAAELDIIDNIKKGVEFKGINLWTLIFAIFIASIGLNVNSTAVIIGAMLISPLMGPIMGLGLGVGIYDFDLIKKSFSNLLIATLIGLFSSTLYFLISPLHQAQSELLSRTTPTIWDVLIAFFGGLAGIVASSRTKYNNVIPGVAIATALMPPLCTAGYGIATWQLSYFFGAIYLYIINSVFISISTFLIIRYLKFKIITNVNEVINIKIKRWISIIAVFTIIPSIYLAYVFVKNEVFKQNADKLISEELISNGITVLNKKINPKNNEISITILDFAKTDSLKKLLEIKKGKYDLVNSKIIIQSSSFNSKQYDFNMEDLKEGIVNDLFNKQKELISKKNEEVNEFKKINDEHKKFEDKKHETIKEFYVLYGKPKELVIEKTMLYSNNTNDTILFVYIKNNGNINPSELNKMKSWLKVKFEINTIKILNN